MPDASQTGQRIAIALYISGVVTIAVAVALGLLLDPIWFAIAALAIIDFVLGWMFSAGHIGPLAERRRAEASGDAAAVAEADPAYNPYARED